jgi:hypothetical protein
MWAGHSESNPVRLQRSQPRPVRPLEFRFSPHKRPARRAERLTRSGPANVTGPLSEASGVTSESRFAYNAKIRGFENSAISQRGSPPPAPPVAFRSLPRPPQRVRVVARLRKAYDLAEARCTQVLVRSTPSGCQGAAGELLDGFRWQQFACRGRQLLQGHLRRRGAAQRALPRQDERLAVRIRQVRQHPKSPPFPPIMESATAGVRT